MSGCLDSCCGGGGAQPLLAAPFEKCARYPALEQLDSSWTVAQLCDALETKPPRSFAECEQLKASIGAEDHQAAARAAAAELQAHGSQALRELQELDLTKQMRLRAFFLTSGEPSLTLTEDGRSRVRPGGALARVFEKPGSELLQGLAGQRRLELCRQLLASWEAVLGDAWRVDDLLDALETSQGEQETVHAAIALLQALITGGRRAWQELRFLDDRDPAKLLDKQQIVGRAAQRLLDAAQLEADKKLKLGVGALARQLLLVAGSSVSAVDAGLDELLAEGWSAEDVLRALDFICDEELSFHSACLVAGKDNMLAEVKELESEKRARLLTLLLMFSYTDAEGLAELLAAGWSVAELYRALEEASAGWSFRHPQQKGAARIVGSAIHAGGEAYEQQLAQLTVDEELRLRASALGRAGDCAERRGEELAKLSAEGLVKLCLHSSTIARAEGDGAGRVALYRAGASLQARLGEEEKDVLTSLDSAARRTLFAQLLLLGMEEGAMVELLAGIAAEEELDAAMEELPLDERAEGGTARKSKEAVIKFAQNKYSWLVVGTDTCLPVVDLVLDLANAVTYIIHKRFQYLTVIGMAMLFNTVSSTFVMAWFEEAKDRYGLASMVLNVLTLGTFCHLAEGAHCFTTGQKTVELGMFKVFEAVESCASLFVGIYSIFIAGYLPGYPELSSTTLVLRWLSVASSLVTLPKAITDFGKRFLLRGEVKERAHYSDRIRKLSGILALLTFQATEVWAQTTLLVFGLMTRPYGIFFLLATVLCCMAMVIWSKKPSGAGMGEFLVMALLVGPLFMMFNPQSPGPPGQEEGFAVGLVRIATLAAAWSVIAWHWARGLNEELEEQLQTPSCAALVAIAATGTVLHVGCLWQQFLAGRWHSQSRSCCFCCAGSSAESAQE